MMEQKMRCIVVSFGSAFFGAAAVKSPLIGVSIFFGLIAICMAIIE